MTFTLPERLDERERRLIRSCNVANETAEVAEIEREFDALPDAVSEPWTRARLARDAARASSSGSIRRKALRSPKRVSPRESPPLMIGLRSVGKPAVAALDQLCAVTKERLQGKGRATFSPPGFPTNDCAPLVDPT